MEQTAVEYLFEQLWETPKDKFTWHTILEKAKQMEEEQTKKIIDNTIDETLKSYWSIKSK